MSVAIPETASTATRRRGSISRLVLACAVAAGGLVASTVVRASTPAGVVLVATFPGVVHDLDADARRVAWIDSAWVLRVQDGSEARAVRYANAYQEVAVRGAARRLYLEGRRLAWESTRANGAFAAADTVYGADAAAGPARPLAHASRVDGADGGYVTGLAADSSGLAFGTAVVTRGADQRYATTGGTVWATVAGGAKHAVPNVPPSLVVARAGDLVALRPLATTESSRAEPRPTSTIEVRSVRTADLVASVVVPGVRAAALWRRTLVVLGPSTLERYSADDGRRLGVSRVPAGTVADLDVARGRLAVRTAATVSVVTVATGRLVARAQAPPGWTISADAITGASLVWAIQKQVAPGEPSPKTVVSQIRRLSLAR